MTNFLLLLPNSILLLLAAMPIIALLGYLTQRYISLSAKCPRCGNAYPTRKKRSGLWKKVSKARAYQCTNCAHRFVCLY